MNKDIIDNEQNGEGYAVPLKDREVFTEANDISIKELCEKIDKNKLDVQADFQKFGYLQT